MPKFVIEREPANRLISFAKHFSEPFTKRLLPLSANYNLRKDVCYE
ncbi:MAG: hypothetical protein ACI9LM_001217 [Alteromonadaceae bacterium]|jgi:hypothetical protein